MNLTDYYDHRTSPLTFRKLRLFFWANTVRPFCLGGLLWHIWYAGAEMICGTASRQTILSSGCIRTKLWTCFPMRIISLFFLSVTRTIITYGAALSVKDFMFLMKKAAQIHRYVFISRKIKHGLILVTLKLHRPFVVGKKKVYILYNIRLSAAEPADCQRQPLHLYRAIIASIRAHTVRPYIIWSF